MIEPNDEIFIEMKQRLNYNYETLKGSQNNMKIAHSQEHNCCL